MQEDTSQLDRRTFLKFAGSALAGLAGSDAYAQSPEPSTETPLNTRAEPANPIVLKSADLQVILDRHHGLPYEYRLTRANQRMWGEDLGKPVTATLYNQSQGTFSTVPASPSSSKVSRNGADFLFHLGTGKTPSVNFIVRYTLTGSTLRVTFHGVKEFEGYELIEVALPRLATVREEDGPAWLAHGDDGGWLASLSEVKTGSLKPNTFWGDVLATLPILMVGAERVLCVQEIILTMLLITLRRHSGSPPRKCCKRLRREFARTS